MMMLNDECRRIRETWRTLKFVIDCDYQGEDRAAQIAVIYGSAQWPPISF